MKLKKAIEEAQRFGASINWVAVDSDKHIFAFTHQPTLKHSHWAAITQKKYIGVYTGTKVWESTLKKVPKDPTNIGIV